MATFEYVEIPADAIRLKPTSLEPATKILVTLPDTFRSSSSTWRTCSEPLSPAKSALALVPQMLLSASVPAASSPAASVISSVITSPNPRTPSHPLLSTRDPLSVPIMTANFRRFVSRIGPVFWLQDRIEEVIMWKKGWKRTTAWIVVYGFFCYFPKMALLIPHILLLGVMLHYYPDPGAQPVQINVGEGTADWQANIQAVQNLMGAFSDAHDAIVPLLPLLVAPCTPSSTPSPAKSHTKPSSMSTSTPSAPQESISPSTPKFPRRTSDAPGPTAAKRATQPHHPFLIVTLVTLLLFLSILMTELVSLRLLFFIAGAGGVGALHPSIKGSLSVASTALSGSGPGLSLKLSIQIPHLPSPISLFTSVTRLIRHPSCRPFPLSPVSSQLRMRTFTFMLTPRDMYLFFRRFTDNDRLDDAVWRAPLSQVELWENERWIQDTAEGKRRKSVVVFVREDEEQNGDDDAVFTTSNVSTGAITGPLDGGKGTGGTWSKSNLKTNERVGWTRGRDGWSGVGGEVSSNLTFSLSPAWAFINTESWRTDLEAAWAVGVAAPCTSVCVGADEDGWTYTTDTWTHPRPDPRPSDGWVTRRRRWTRRIYFTGGET